MAPPAKRAPIPKDVRAARKVLDEVVHLRQEVKELQREVDRCNRRAVADARQIRDLKAKRTAATKA